MIELHTFGRVELTSSSGQEIRAVLAQPKRAALLVYLAVAQPRGFQRRDALLALFWPELDQERARAALRKAVHHLRRALGDAAIEGRGDEEVRLAEEVVWCDAAAFETALDGGDPEAAVGLYRGPFLDAFFAPDAPEFEQWMESERARLHRRAFDAAWQVTEAEERKGNTFGAAYWARRAAALAPADEGAIRRLMTLLDRLGDRAGAIEAYEEFARRIEADLDVQPSAETQALARAIREAAGSASRIVEAPAVLPAPPAARPAALEPSATPAPRRRRLLGLGLAALAVVLLAAGLAVRWSGRGADVPSGTSPNLIAVFPFTVRGGPPLEYLDEGLSSLLSTGLDGAGELRSVDPHAVLTVVGRDRDATTDPALARRLAGELGAGFYVLGDATGSGAELRIDATLYDASRGGRAVSVATARGTTDSLFALVDLLAAQLITAQRGDSARAVSRLAALTTHSLPALKAYLEGEREFRRGSFPRAIAGYQRAVALDSTFALAYYRLATTYAWSGNDSSLQASEQAVRFGRRLPAADRELLEAQHLLELGQADAAERAYREILRRRPYEVDAIFELGEVLFHFNPGRGRPIAESQAYFDRARKWNHSDAPLIHMLEVMALERDGAGYDSMLAGIQPESHFWHTGRMAHVFPRGDERARAAEEAELSAVPERELATVASHALYLVEEDSAAGRVVRLLVAPSRPVRLRVLGHALLAHLHMSGGRWRAAAAQLDSLRALDPVRAAIHGGLLFAAPHLAIPPAEIDRVRSRVAAAPAAGAVEFASLTYTGDDTLHAELRTYALGLLDARLGRTAEALRHAAALERAPGPTPGVTDALAAGIRAQVRLTQGEPERALAELQGPARPLRVNELMIFSPLGLRHERFLRAEALDRLGRPEEALGWLSSFTEHSAAGRLYLAPAHFRRGEILERLGRRREAAVSYRRFVALWRAADPELQPLVEEGRRRLALLDLE